MGVLQGLPRQLQQDPLLRVHVGGLHRGQAEEFCVEGGDVGEVTAGELGLRHAAGHLRVAGVLAPAALRQLADAAAALLEQGPHGGDGFGAREAGGRADDGDLPVLRGQPLPRGDGDGGGARPGGTGPVDLCHDIGGEGGDGVVLVGHRGVQRHAGEPFQVAGEHDDIAAGQAELLEQAVIGDLRGLRSGGGHHPVTQPRAQLGDGGGGTSGRGRHSRGYSPSRKMRQGQR